MSAHHDTVPADVDDDLSEPIIPTDADRRAMRLWIIGLIVVWLLFAGWVAAPLWP